MRKNFHTDIKSGSFLFWWVMGSLFVYPAVIVFGCITFIIVSIIANVARASIQMSWSSNLDWLWMALVLPLVVGAVVGYVQRGLLRKYMYWTSDRWMLASTLGGALGAVLCIPIFAFNISDSDGVRVYAMMMPVFILAVSACQWFSLRRATRLAWLWVAANFVGGLVFASLLINYVPQIYYTPNYPFLSIGIWLAAAVAQGLVTGVVVLHLFEKHSYEPVLPEELRGTDLDPRRRPSVWDKAI